MCVGGGGGGRGGATTVVTLRLEKALPFFSFKSSFRHVNCQFHSSLKKDAEGYLCSHASVRRSSVEA